MRGYCLGVSPTHANRGKHKLKLKICHLRSSLAHSVAHSLILSLSKLPSVGRLGGVIAGTTAGACAGGQLRCTRVGSSGGVC